MKVLATLFVAVAIAGLAARNGGGVEAVGVDRHAKRADGLLEVSGEQQMDLMTADARERARVGVDEATVELAATTGLVRIPLARATIKDHTTVLMQLRAQQQHPNGMYAAFVETTTGEAAGDAAGGSDVPLTQEVLRQKHLATYYGHVRIGPTKFRILFDTGSCEFWVPSSKCPMERCKKHIAYPLEEDSETRTNAGKRLNIQYLSGRVSGKMIYEKVKTGDVTVNHQIIGVADHVDIVLLDDVIWDGILGLAYPNRVLSARGVVPFFDNVMKTGALTKRGLANQFGYFIDDSKGSVTFGGVDCTLIGVSAPCIKHFGFVPVSEKSYWTVRINDVRVKYAGQPAMSGFCPRNGCKAIVDTGTYLLYGPGAAVRKMLKPAKFAGCTTIDRLPSFTFDFAVGDGPAVELTLNPIDYVLKFDVDNGADCVSGISPDRDVIWTLGQVFLRSFYSVFDRDRNRIGFARIPRTELQSINAHSDAEAQSLLEAQSATALDDFTAAGGDANSVVWAERSTAEADAGAAEGSADADDEAESESDSDEADESGDADDEANDEADDEADDGADEADASEEDTSIESEETDV